MMKRPFNKQIVWHIHVRDKRIETMDLSALANRVKYSSRVPPSKRSKLSVKSPGHNASASFLLSPLVSEIGGDHVLHGHAHRLIHGDLIVATTTRFPAKSYRS
jgi:hypothetical protein